MLGTSVPFDLLPGAIRARLAGSARLEEKPFPIHQVRHDDAIFARIGAGIVLAAGVGLAIWWMQERWWETEGVFLFDALITFLVTWGLAIFVKEALRPRVLPFPAGIYLFATDVVIAHDHVLRIVSLADLVVRGVRWLGPGTWRVEEKGRTVELWPAKGGERVLVLSSRDLDVERATRELVEAKAAFDEKRVAAEDDLFREIRGGDGALDVRSLDGSGDGPRARPLPILLRHAWLTALVLALTIGATAAATNPPRPHAGGEPRSTR